MRFFAFLTSLCFLIGLSSCNQEKQIMVHVYDNKLTLDELQKTIPVYDKNVDSVELNRQYIDSWVERQVMLHNAEKNLTLSEKRFDRQIREYKESLLIDAYENKKVKQLLDTIVTEKEILDYYMTNKMYFTTKRAIVKVNYIKLLPNFPQVETVKKLLFKNNRTEQEQEKLKSFTENKALNIYMSDNWLLFDDMLKEIPISTYNNTELFLEKNKTLEIKDESGIYLVNFLDFKMDEEDVPKDADRKIIVRAILQHRKIDILKKIREEAVRKAKESGEVLFN